MRPAIVIATRCIRQRIRDRSAILFAVVIPLGLATAFSLLIPRGSEFHTAFIVHDGDGGAVAAALVDHLTGPISDAGIADVSLAGSEDQALDALDDGATSVAILIPAGFTEAVTSGATAEIRIVGLPEAPLGTQIAQSIVSGFASEVGAVQLAIVTAADWSPGLPLPAIEPATVTQIQSLPSPIHVGDTTLERRQADTTTFYAAAMSIMFVFFSTIHGPLGLLGERRGGTLARLLAAPIRPGSIVVGAALVSFVLGIVSMTVLVVATTLLLGATWGPPLYVAAICLAAVVAAMGMSMLVCTFARTDQQAGGWNAMIAITLAILGGAMVPLSEAPELLHQLGRVTPHAWFLEAVDNMSATNVSVADIIPAVVFLVGFGVVAGLVALARAPRFLAAR
jgi:ABC-2 type transport system permease protein